MPLARRALLFAGVAALGACSPLDVIKPYRMDIQQGNYISQEMVSQLKVGMTKEQVRYVLGTPLVADIFHADRWDYVYYRDPRRGAREQRKIAVIFEQGKLARVQGDVIPAEPKSEPVPKTPAAAPQPAAQPAKPAAEAPKPAAEAPKPIAGAAKPADEPAPTVQNWKAASDEPAQGEPAKEEAATTESPQPEQQSERGFFGRILEKLGL